MAALQRAMVAFVRFAAGTVKEDSIRRRDGTVYGIELLNANAQLRACDEGHFVLVDETAGRRVEVPLPEVA